jgi:hypothetical protein
MPTSHDGFSARSRSVAQRSTSSLPFTPPCRRRGERAALTRDGGRHGVGFLHPEMLQNDARLSHRPMMICVHPGRLPTLEV